MIWSVSTSERSSGTAVPCTIWTASISAPPSRSVGRAKWPAMAVAAATAGETRWVRPPRPCRPSKLRLLVDADALARRELVGVHGQAHRAARLPPVEAGGGEHPVEPLGLGLVLHGERAGHDEGAHAVLHLAALGHRGGRAQVLDAGVGAAADEHGVDGDVAHRRAGGEPHVLEGAGGAVALVRVGEVVRATGWRRRAARPGPGWCPRRRAARWRRRRGAPPCRRRRRRRWAARASRRAPPPTPRPSGRGCGPRGRRR